MLQDMGSQAEEGTLTSDSLCKTLVSYTLNKIALESEDGTKGKKRKSDNSVFFPFLMHSALKSRKRCNFEKSQKLKAFFEFSCMGGCKLKKKVRHIRAKLKFFFVTPR